MSFYRLRLAIRLYLVRRRAQHPTDRWFDWRMAWDFADSIEPANRHNRSNPQTEET